MLGYAPKRNTASVGIMKITAIQTTQNVTDSFGNSIANTKINFDDNSETENYDNFINIMNAHLPRTTSLPSQSKSNSRRRGFRNLYS